MSDDTQPMQYNMMQNNENTQRIQKNEFPGPGGDLHAQNTIHDPNNTYHMQDDMPFMQPPPPYTQEPPSGNPPYQQEAMQAFMQPLGQYIQGNTPYISGEATDPYTAGTVQYAQNNMPPTQYNGPYEQAEGQLPSSGQSAPTRPPLERKRLYIIGGATVLALLLLVIGGIFLLPGLTRSNNAPAATPPVSAQATPPAKRPASKNPYTPYLSKYGPTIRNSVAQGLHLTPAELRTQLHSGKTLSAIATAQGLSASQLQTLVTDAFQNGLKPAVTSGGLTQKQVDALVKRMLKQPQALDRFLAPGAAAKAKPRATPTAAQ